MINFKRNTALSNKRIKHELAKLGYTLDNIPPSINSPRLNWLLNNQLQRVMVNTPVGRRKSHEQTPIPSRLL
jgi:hypothetical protein